jgi:hypothetical protein
VEYRKKLHITREGSHYYESGLAIPFLFEADACSASLPGRVKNSFSWRPFGCAPGQRIRFGKEETPE